MNKAWALLISLYSTSALAGVYNIFDDGIIERIFDDADVINARTLIINQCLEKDAMIKIEGEMMTCSYPVDRQGIDKVLTIQAQEFGSSVVIDPNKAIYEKETHYLSNKEGLIKITSIYDLEIPSNGTYVYYPIQHEYLLKEKDKDFVDTVKRNSVSKDIDIRVRIFDEINTNIQSEEASLSSVRGDFEVREVIQRFDQYLNNNPLKSVKSLAANMLKEHPYMYVFILDNDHVQRLTGKDLVMNRLYVKLTPVFDDKDTIVVNAYLKGVVIDDTGKRFITYPTRFNLAELIGNELIKNGLD